MTEPGVYTIVINSANGTLGQFVVTMGGVIPAPPPPPNVSEGNPASGALNPGDQATFDVVGNPNAATIVDLGDVTATAGLTIELRDPADNLVGVMSGGLIGGTLIIPPTDGVYKITLVNNTAAPIPYNISVSVQTTDESQQAEEETSPVEDGAGGAQPGLPTDGACVLATRDFATVNVRENPSLNSDVIADLDPTLTYPVTAQNFDGSWLRVVINQTEGWVSWFVTRQGGNCSAVPIIGGDQTQPVATPPAPAATEEADQTEPAPAATEDAEQPQGDQQPDQQPDEQPQATEDVQDQQPAATEEPQPQQDQQQEQQQQQPTATYTPSYTPTAIQQQEQQQEQQQQPTATYTPSYTPTTPPAAQIAPEDARFNNPLNIQLDSTASVLDFVSYPGGDNEDRVRWDIIGMNNNSSLSGGRARLVISVTCFGEGTDQVQFFTGGQTYFCGSTIVDQEVTANSKTGSVVITAVGGQGTYVQWVLTGTATRVN